MSRLPKIAEKLHNFPKVPIIYVQDCLGTRTLTILDHWLDQIGKSFLLKLCCFFFSFSLNFHQKMQLFQSKTIFWNSQKLYIVQLNLRGLETTSLRFKNCSKYTCRAFSFAFFVQNLPQLIPIFYKSRKNVYSNNSGQKYWNFFNIFLVIFKPQAIKKAHNRSKQTVKIYL